MEGHSKTITECPYDINQKRLHFNLRDLSITDCGFKKGLGVRMPLGQENQKHRLPRRDHEAEPMFWCLVAKSCPALSNPMDCSLPGSSVHGILQARILEWVATSSSRNVPQPSD